VIKTLLVEDNVEFRAFLKALLLERFPDGVIQETSDALEALRLIGEARHDVVVVDIGLPGSVNGLMLVARIREQGRRPPILVISNYAIPEYQLEAARLGADWFLPKIGSTSQEIIAAFERLMLLGAEPPPES
jgi:DNA-binding NarL/FixJ family response regulator